MRCPTRAVKLASFSAARGGTRWMAAFSVVSSTNFPGTAPCASAASVAIRAAMISPAGETRS